MIQILDGLWLNSLIGLGIIVLITLIDLGLVKRQTSVVMFLNQATFSGISILFGWPCIIYSVLCFALIIVVRYRHRYVFDEPLFDYSQRIFSLSAIFNKLKSTKKDEIIIGRITPVNKAEIKHNQRAIAVNDTLLSGATLITGSTGSGKTTGMKSIMKQAIHQGKPVVFVDYKGEVDILDDLEAYCNQLNIPYYEFSARRCTFCYDPLVNLNETGRVEALMNTRRWSADGADEHYKTSTQLVLQNVIHAYDEYRAKTNDTKNYLIGLRDFTYRYKPESNERDGFNTLVKQLEILLSSKSYEMFKEDKEIFSFEREAPFVICFSFISANKALANSLSSFIFQDIMDRGTRKHYNPKMLLCIDEFGTLDSSTLIKDLLEKGRSGGCQTIFSILDINQIAMNAGEYFVNAILGTINSFIIYAGATQTTADLLAGVQKYDNKGYSIMDLRKPYRGKPPTALMISKYPILSKRGNQEIYKIIPYIFKNTGAPVKPKKRVVKVSKNVEYEDTLEEAQQKQAAIFEASQSVPDDISDNVTMLNGVPIDVTPESLITPGESEYDPDKPTIISNIDDFI